MLFLVRQKHRKLKRVFVATSRQSCAWNGCWFENGPLTWLMVRGTQKVPFAFPWNWKYYPRQRLTIEKKVNGCKERNTCCMCRTKHNGKDFSSKSQHLWQKTFLLREKNNAWLRDDEFNIFFFFKKFPSTCVLLPLTTVSQLHPKKST